MLIKSLLKGYGSMLLLIFGMCIGIDTTQAQSGVQRLDERILEELAEGRTDGQTKLWRFVSNANNYVNAGIPVGVLIDGLIRNDDRTKRDGLYMATSTASTFLLNLAIKKLVKRPRPFLTDVTLVPVYRPGE